MTKGGHDARNWEQGMPLERTYDSAMRHLTQWLEERLTGINHGDSGDDHLAQCAFNLMALMFIEEGIDLGKLPKELDVTRVEYSATTK